MGLGVCWTMQPVRAALPLACLLLLLRLRLLRLRLPRGGDGGGGEGGGEGGLLLAQPDLLIEATRKDLEHTVGALASVRGWVSTHC